MRASMRKHGTPLSAWIHVGISCLSSILSWRMMPSASSRLGRRRGGSEHTMKPEQLKKRLDRDRPMTTISIRFPVDVIEDLKRVAPLRGFSGYQPLVRAYVGQGLRMDLERLENDTMAALVESLKRQGVSEEVIDRALGE